jgi:predicted nucleic acid-binding protein
VIWFIEPSALVKNYLLETGTNWVRTALSATSQGDLFLSRIAGAEVGAALRRAEKGKRIAGPDYQLVLSEFRKDLFSRFTILEVTPTIVEVAMQLSDKHGLRGYDAVHLATALTIHQFRAQLHLPTITLISADGELIDAARVEGLPTDNPDDHP